MGVPEVVSVPTSDMHFWDGVPAQRSKADIAARLRRDGDGPAGDLWIAAEDSHHARLKTFRKTTPWRRMVYAEPGSSANVWIISLMNQMIGCHHGVRTPGNRCRSRPSSEGRGIGARAGQSAATRSSDRRNPPGHQSLAQRCAAGLRNDCQERREAVRWALQWGLS